MRYDDDPEIFTCPTLRTDEIETDFIPANGNEGFSLWPRIRPKFRSLNKVKVLNKEETEAYLKKRNGAV